VSWFYSLKSKISVFCLCQVRGKYYQLPTKTWYQEQRKLFKGFKGTFKIGFCTCFGEKNLLPYLRSL